MAYTYLDVTNEVLNRFNEVELTSSGFGNARGFQIQCKNAVNDAINYIYQREFGWSFSHALQTETLVASTTRYTISSSIYHTDFETFRIEKNDSLGVDGVSLLENKSDRQSSYWIYTLKVERQADFVNKMKECGIMVSRVHERNDDHSCVSQYKSHLPNLDKLVKEMICIPVGWWVTSEDREYIVDCIKGGW